MRRANRRGTIGIGADADPDQAARPHPSDRARDCGAVRHGRASPTRPAASAARRCARGRTSRLQHPRRAARRTRDRGATGAARRDAPGCGRLRRGRQGRPGRPGSRARRRSPHSGVDLTVEQRFTRTVNAVVATVRGDQRARLAARARPCSASIPCASWCRPPWPSPSRRRSAMPCGRSAPACRATAAASPSRSSTGRIDETHAALAGPRRPSRGRRTGLERRDRGARHGDRLAGAPAVPARPGCTASRRPRASSPSACSTPAADGALAGTTADLLAGLEQAADPDGNGDLADHARVAVAAVAAPFAGVRRRARGPRDRERWTRSAPSSSRRPATTAPPAPATAASRAPAAPPDALTVGASDGRPALPQVVARSSAARSPSTSRSGPLAGALAPQAGQALPVKTITGAGAHDAHARARWPPTTRAPTARPLVAGAAVLVPRDGGDLRAKVRQAAAQGAAAVLLYGTADLPAGALGGDDRVGIPVLAHRRCARPAHRPGGRRRTGGDRHRRRRDVRRRTRSATPSRPSRRRASAGTTA